MAYDIFISYRREGGFETAKHLYDLLSHEGYSVSFDIDTLRNGRFDVALLKRIDECKDFILIVNKDAFAKTLDPDFPPENDWLRIELAYAHKKGKNIIPVLLSEATFPDNLPQDLAEIPFQNGPGYSKDYFDAFYKRLKEYFKTSVPTAKKPSVVHDVSEKAEIHINTDADCNIYDYGKKIGELKKGDNVIYLKRGRHKLRFKQTLLSSSPFISFSNNELLSCIEKEYNITTDIDNFDLNFAGLDKKEGWKRVLSSFSFYNYIVAVSALIISIIGCLWCLIDDGYNSFHYQLGIIGICAAIYFIILKFCKHIFDEEWGLSSGGILGLVFYWLLIILVPIGLTIFIYELFLSSESIFDTVNYTTICWCLWPISSATLIYLLYTFIQDMKKNL